MPETRVLTVQRLAAFGFIAFLLLLSGCDNAGDPSGTFTTSSDSAGGVTPPAEQLDYHAHVSGLLEEPIEIRSSGQLYRIFESGVFSDASSDVSIVTQPGDTKCFLFRQFDDLREKYLECYDRTIASSNVSVPVGSFVYRITSEQEVLYSSEELRFVEDVNASNGYSHVATDDSGLFFTNTASVETTGYFTDAPALGGTADYFAIEQELFSLLQNTPSITSIDTTYTHEVVGVLYDVEYRIHLGTSMSPMGLVTTMAQALKVQTDGTIIEHLPYGYEGSSSSDYVFGVTIFPSTPSNTFYALRAATQETLGVGNHFPTTNINNGD